MVIVIGIEKESAEYAHESGFLSGPVWRVTEGISQSQLVNIEGEKLTVSPVTARHSLLAPRKKRVFDRRSGINKVSGHPRPSDGANPDSGSR